MATGNPPGTPGSTAVDQVSYSSLEGETGTPVPLEQIGLQLAKGLLGLIVLILLLVGLFAWLTFPDEPLVVAAGSGIKADDLARVVDEARRAWFTQIKDLLQLLIVSLSVPLLTTVIGYIFGRQAEQ